MVFIDNLSETTTTYYKLKGDRNKIKPKNNNNNKEKTIERTEEA